MIRTDHYELVLEALVAEGRAPRKVRRRAVGATAGANHQPARPRTQPTAVRPIVRSARRSSGLATGAR